MLCALVRENVIVQVLELAEEQVQEACRVYERVVDISEMTPTPQQGWVYDGNGGFVTPNSLNPSRVVTRLAFMNRFKDNEIGAIYTIANTPGHPLQIPFKIYTDKLLASTFVDLGRPDTTANLNLLVSLGILTSTRATEILTAQVQPIERPVQ